MFSGRNTYLIPATASAGDLDGVEILLHHHHHHQFLHHHHHHQPDAFSGLYLAAPNAPPVFEGGEASASASAPAPARKQAVKKDRHSKIQTAQGPRDRRVRLSIGIARKFFDLQEMLGFDKPSKTLDWLLTKSKAAIKELVHTSASSSPSACEIDQSGGAADSSRKSGKASSSVAKESRAKARARARERTLEKMCIKQLEGSDQNQNQNQNHPSFDQCSRNNQLEFLQLSAGSATAYHLPLANEQDLIQESVVIKRKNKNNNNPSSLLGFHQNLVLNSNYTTIPSANTATHDNWDVFGQSNLHAAFDHHKFFNSSSNI